MIHGSKQTRLIGIKLKKMKDVPKVRFDPCFHNVSQSTTRVILVCMNKDSSMRNIQSCLGQERKKKSWIYLFSSL
jgi:hypothetical protein